MPEKKFHIQTLRILILGCLLVFLGSFVARYVDLMRSDIGRHLKNGEIILAALAGHRGLTADVLNTNYYSYTFHEYPVINHHWGSGVIFYLIYKLGGVGALSYFYIFLTLAAFLVFFDAARRQSGFYACVFLAALLIPLIAERKEIRPEGFSYVFAGIYYWVLSRYKSGEIKSSWLLALPLVQLVWANTHIYFIFGPFIIMCFLAGDIIKRGAKWKELSAALAASAAASAATPFGVKGLLYPFNIFSNYGYRLVENQSVRFLENYGIINTNFLLLKIAAGLMALSFVIVFLSNSRNFPVEEFFIGTVFAMMAAFALRNFTIFGLFALPVIAGNIRLGFPKASINSKNMAVFFFIAALAAFLSGFSRNYPDDNAFTNSVHTGMAPHNDAAADFFIRNNIKGPVFNNYDIGSYLIFYLFPRERVFTDNRPEAYPASFFKDTYVPMQESPEKFALQDKIYNFKAVFFSHHDITPWGQAFLIRMVDDKNWAPVFADNYAVIFLKRNTANQPLINKYEVPRGRFRVTKNK